MDAALALIVNRVRAAAAQQTPLAIHGGGTKHFHRCAPSMGEVIDTRPLSGIVLYDPAELVVTVRAGTPLADVEAALAEHGQCLAFEPPHFAKETLIHSSSQAGFAVLDAVQGANHSNSEAIARICNAAMRQNPQTPAARGMDQRFLKRGTIGGMVASGLSGPARANVGAVRDFVLGIEIINGKGELLRFGGQVMKNVAGYDVSRLMTGAWGQLGIITEVSLKTLPIPPAEATLRFYCSQQDALTRLHAWGSRPLPLNASTWQSGGTLMVRLRGAQAAVQWATQDMLRSMRGEVLEDTQNHWQDCRNQRLPWFLDAHHSGLALWRLSLPQTTPPLALPQGIDQQMVEWHGAQRWVWAPLSQGAALTTLAQQAGGSAALFKIAQHPDAATRPAQPTANSLPWPANSAQATIHRRLKQAFDPAELFNRGAALP